MRYRPFGHEGRSSSAVGLILRPGRKPEEAFALLCAALEAGVNTVSFAAGDEAAAQAVRRAVAAVGRRVLILLLRLDLEAGGPEAQVRTALRASGATMLDAAMLHHPPAGPLSPGLMAELERVRTAGLALRIGVADEAEAAQPRLMEGVDLLSLRYSIASGWAERNVLKAAAERGVTVLGYGPNPQPEEPAKGPVRGLFRRFSAAAPRTGEAYRFLRETPDWSAEQICLAFALTEPGLASVMVEADSPKALEALCSVVEREMPTGVAAQIEMARFAGGGQRGAA
jgi:aryl-alcohol dehydrogenase-like predicted oxidoreductase